MLFIFGKFLYNKFVHVWIDDMILLVYVYVLVNGFSKSTEVTNVLIWVLSVKIIHFM